MTSWELASRLRSISRLIPFAPNPSGALRYLDMSTDMFTLDLDEVSPELINHLVSDGYMGPNQADVILDMFKDGQSSIEKSLRQTVPKGIQNLLELDNLHPSTVKQLFDYGINTIYELSQLVKKDSIYDHKGFSKRFVDQLKHQLVLYNNGRRNLFLFKAFYMTNLISRMIMDTRLVDNSIIAGDIRRGKEEITHIDILCTCETPSKAISERVMQNIPVQNAFITSSGFKCTFDSMETRVHFCKQKYIGSALCYFTGPSEHYQKLIKLAPHSKSTRSGFYRIIGDEQVFYKKLGLAYIPPEIREWPDAIELTGYNDWNLVEIEDIKGDLHTHTTWSDGRSSFSSLSKTAKSVGLDYIAITDHAENIGSSKGLNLVSLKKQINRIHRMNSNSNDFEMIPGIELNINREGRVDYTFMEGAVRLGAIHSSLGQKKPDITKRYINVIRSGDIDVIAHPTGRKLKVRSEIQADWYSIFSECSKYHVAVELNYAPDRMDISWELARMADKCGCHFSIGGDIHYARQMKNIRFGVLLARRAGLSSEKVLNCFSPRDIRRLMWNRK